MNTHNVPISIIICTRNRAEHLRQTLHALRHLNVSSAFAAELLIVDNASTDHTKDVVMKAGLKNMSVRYLLETSPGQCYARNTGLANSQGRVIVFTDDDVRPAAGWIEGMCNPILSGKADAVAGGIRQQPHILS